MAIQKIEIIISAIIVFCLVALFILDSAKLATNYLITTIVSTLIYLAVCYLHIKRVPTLKWKILMVILCLGLLAGILSVHFYRRPRRWDFQSRLIFGIDVVAMVAFLLMIFTRDRRSTVLLTTFTAAVVLLFINLADLEQSNIIFTVVVSIIIYLVISTFHVTQILYQRWKISALALSFTVIVVLCVLLRIYGYDTEIFFQVITGIDACFSLVPWLWITFAPKVKAWRRVYLEQEMIQVEEHNFLEMARLPTRFTLKELDTATASFQAPIGEGASGAVFKGTMRDGSVVAVKRIKGQASGETEFRTEITIIASLQHVNLVRLVGYCLSPRGDRYLIYPFFENGSLDAWIFADDVKRSRLTWAIRNCIAIDVAKALVYLHHDCHHRILHLDIKPANILLDGSFKALVSDFGISKLIGRDESRVMTRARGTVGYLAPEMLVPNAISTKCDVYSYGMVLLELIGGRRNFMSVMDKESQQRRNSYFPKIAREKMMQGKLIEVVDESLVKNEEIREEEVTVLVLLALWCIQQNPELRPSMTEAVEILEGRIPVHMPPESSMFVFNFLDMDSQCSTSRAPEDDAAIVSTNAMSISIQLGR